MNDHPTTLKTRRQPLLTRVLSFVFGCAMWALWLWLIVPAPISAELRRRIVATSLHPSLHVVETLSALYLVAVVSCRARKPWRSVAKITSD